MIVHHGGGSANHGPALVDADAPCSQIHKRPGLSTRHRRARSWPSEGDSSGRSNAYYPDKPWIADV
jgi:hypothetical protein